MTPAENYDANLERIREAVIRYRGDYFQLCMRLQQIARDLAQRVFELESKEGRDGN